MDYKFPKIIGLLARSRSGKDTVADYIISNYKSYNIVKRRLAGPIKNAVKELYGLNDVPYMTLIQNFLK